MGDLGQDVTLRILDKLDADAGRGTLDNGLSRFCLPELMNRLRRKSRATTHEHLAVKPPARDVESDIDPDATLRYALGERSSGRCC